MLKLVRNLNALSKMVSKPGYANKSIVDFNNRKSEQRDREMNERFNAEISRIKQEMHQMRSDMELMRLEIENFKAKS